jgi:hypothetical protein
VGTLNQGLYLYNATLPANDDLRAVSFCGKMEYFAYMTRNPAFHTACRIARQGFIFVTSGQRPEENSHNPIPLPER